MYVHSCSESYLMSCHIRIHEIILVKTLTKLCIEIPKNLKFFITLSNLCMSASLALKLKMHKWIPRNSCIGISNNRKLVKTNHCDKYKQTTLYIFLILFHVSCKLITYFKKPFFFSTVRCVETKSEELEVRDRKTNDTQLSYYALITKLLRTKC